MTVKSHGTDIGHDNLLRGKSKTPLEISERGFCCYFLPLPPPLPLLLSRPSGLGLGLGGTGAGDAGGIAL